MTRGAFQGQDCVSFPFYLTHTQQNTWSKCSLSSKSKPPFPHFLL